MEKRHEESKETKVKRGNWGNRQKRGFEASRFWAFFRSFAKALHEELVDCNVSCTKKSSQLKWSKNERISGKSINWKNVWRGRKREKSEVPPWIWPYGQGAERHHGCPAEAAPLPPPCPHRADGGGGGCTVWFILNLFLDLINQSTWSQNSRKKIK